MALLLVKHIQLVLMVVILYLTQLLQLVVVMEVHKITPRQSAVVVVVEHLLGQQLVLQEQGVKDLLAVMRRQQVIIQVAVVVELELLE